MTAKTAARPKANPANPLEIAAPMPGVISKMLVATGEEVSPGQKLFVLEAMKMETTVCADKSGIASLITVSAGAQVEGGDLIVKIEPL